jgi:hypothetical protein
MTRKDRGSTTTRLKWEYDNSLATATTNRNTILVMESGFATKTWYHKKREADS